MLSLTASIKLAVCRREHFVRFMVQVSYHHIVRQSTGLNVLKTFAG